MPEQGVVIIYDLKRKELPVGVFGSFLEAARFLNIRPGALISAVKRGKPVGQRYLAIFYSDKELNEEECDE